MLLSLGLAFNSCSQNISNQSDISFSIPQQVFRQIADRAASEASGANDNPYIEIVSVPDDALIQFEISLFSSNDTKIAVKSDSKTFQDWLKASEDQDISFSFSNIQTGKKVYATASATAQVNERTVELCSGKSEIITVAKGTNQLPLTLIFTVVNQSQEEPVAIDVNTTFTIQDGLLNLSATPAERIFLNKGAITLGATLRSTDTDVTNNSDITWTAQLYYGGVEINSSCDKQADHYYSFTTEDTPIIQITNMLETAGMYQLYITATYNGVTSSQMFDIPFDNTIYKSYSASDSNIFQVILNENQNISSNLYLVIYGNFDNGEEISERYRSMSTAIQNIPQDFEMDLSNMTGLTEFPGQFNAFRLTSLILPDCLTTIGNESWYTPNLKSLTIPAGIETINATVLKNGNKLDEIKITGNNTKYSIDKNYCLFETAGSEKTLLFVPINYKQSINFATDFPGITAIGEGAFKYTNLTEITGFGSFKTIPKDAFYECELLTTVNLEGVETVGDTAFYHCYALTTLENYESLRTVGDAAFSNQSAGYSRIQHFTINENLTLGTNAFNYAIEELTLDIEVTSANMTEIKTKYLRPTYGTQHIIFNKSVVIPDDSSNSFTLAPTTNLPKTNNTFNSFLSDYKGLLQSIEFKGANSSIGQNQFIYFKKLTQIKTNGNVTAIGDFAFYGCDKLESVDLNGVSYVGTCAFEKCSLLSSLNLGNTIKQIGQRAFYEANGLAEKSITIPLSTFAIGSSSFYVSSGTQPTITIVHATSPQTETWYSVPYPSSTNNYWNETVMKLAEFQGFTELPTGVTPVTDSDNLIQTSVTSTSNGSEYSYLRAINQGE